MEYQEEKKSWFSRNWGWAVPLGGCLTIVVLFFVFLGSLFFGVSSLMTGSDPYKEGIAKAKQDTYLIELLGEPIETNGIMQGSISIENNTGKADISVPIKGPKGTATLYVEGTKTDGEWSYEEIYVIIQETDEQIDLLGYERSDSLQQ
ncbi:hypothetical protein HN014_06120 [Aquimarina sp. TRL1]|uniref:cytochrome c oxidase assembly factor Coa1 family protein n=1 Tax=Aquimarina sp. (strain TRL1) TaxID=2736252 RepID=UPI0015899EA1|nr:cytochrome c oxidase assembly factor Coa1 family protein [Aquimarina sp. TRL1]QKX04506.1 hypothetical protein HN014_06120 [Aquimarina sp. TRL1]